MTCILVSHFAFILPTTSTRNYIYLSLSLFDASLVCLLSLTYWPVNTWRRNIISCRCCGQYTVVKNNLESEHFSFAIYARICWLFLSCCSPCLQYMLWWDNYLTIFIAISGFNSVLFPCCMQRQYHCMWYIHSYSMKKVKNRKCAGGSIERCLSL